MSASKQDTSFITTSCNPTSGMHIHCMLDKLHTKSHHAKTVLSHFLIEDHFLAFPKQYAHQLRAKFHKILVFQQKYQRWSRGHKARGQGQGQGQGPKKNPRPRPRPRTAFPRTEPIEAKDRNARGQGQGPRTLLSKKKKGLHKNFSGDLHEKTFLKNFSSAPQNFNNSKNSAVLEPRTGQFSRT